MSLRMLGDALRGPGNRLIGHSHRPAAPALVSALVDVTVVARKIAAAVDLENELTQRYSRPAHAGPSGSDRGVECGYGNLPGQRRRNEPAKRAVQNVLAQRRHVRERHLAQICQVRRVLRPLVISGYHRFFGPSGVPVVSRLWLLVRLGWS